MASGEVETTIQRSPDEAWKVVADFGGLDTWNDAIETCDLDGEVRHLKMLGLSVDEKLVRSDDAARAQTYSVISGVPGLERHEATITVHDAGDGASSRVTWGYDVAPDAMGDIMRGAYDAGLQSLKKHLES